MNLNDTLKNEDEGTQLLAACVDSALKFTNVVVLELTPEARAALNAAIFAGARVALTVELTPSLAVRGTLQYSEQTIQLFEVQLTSEHPSPLLN